MKIRFKTVDGQNLRDLIAEIKLFTDKLPAENLISVSHSLNDSGFPDRYTAIITYKS